MKVSRFVNCFIAAIGFSTRTYAQVPGTYTDPESGITFSTTYIGTDQTAGGFTLGIALPPSAISTASNDYLGLIIGGVTDGGGWSGISHGMTGMPSSLLLMVWPYGDTVFGSFRYADAYVAPDLYTGNATFSTISTSVNLTHYSITYLCKNCLVWDQDGEVGSQSTADGVLILGWCQASVSPPDPADVNGPIIVEHDLGQGIFGAPVEPMLQSSYSLWTTKTQTTTSIPTNVPTGTVTVTTVSATPTSYSSIPVPTTTYDYIVVGAGAGGIPMADKLSEAGHSVLLIERGPPSSGRWGGVTGGGSATKSDWLIGTNLTRFDVPGLCNEIWEDATGISCPDTDQMEGCVLGGGTAVNAGLWWNPNPVDWDVNFPPGWQSSDVAAATSRVFSLIPGTDVPSADNVLYLQGGYNVIASGLESAGWIYVTANNVPGQKNRTYAHTPYMYSHGERGGPMATYLVSASERSNFHLIMNTTVEKVIRSAGHITGVQVQAYGDGGYEGVINVTPATGRVILSAGTFGSAKILLRSGIGPQDQLAIVSNSTDGPTMIGSNAWIDVPVGYNLDDHCDTDVVITHPNASFYNFYTAFQDPIPSDEEAYLSKREGIFTQAAPNIGPMFWDEITGADGVIRQLQYTARVEGSNGYAEERNNTMTISQYLGRGAVSRGRATITPSLSMSVSTVPYLHNADDVAAIISGLEHLQTALSTVPNLEWLVPSPGISVIDYVNNLPVVASTRTANHWIGTAKIGNDDGRQGGTAVVDINTKVWGTDNLFVVDASIFPGEPSTNPSSLIVVAAEHASDLILALEFPAPVEHYSICGGSTYSGSMNCQSPFTCTFVNSYYWQCL